MDFTEATRKESNEKLAELIEDYLQEQESKKGRSHIRALAPLVSEIASHFYWYGMEDGAELSLEAVRKQWGGIGKI